MNIYWSYQAVSDLKMIRSYIAADNPVAARKLAAKIKGAVLRLANFPLSGREGRVHGTRELVIPGTSYIVVYRVCEDGVEIITVLHGRQSWPESLS